MKTNQEFSIQHPWGLQPIFENIPKELHKGKWCVWRARPDPKKPGKINKVPYRPNLNRCTGLSTKEPEKWGSFEEAKNAYLKNKDFFDGVGYLVADDFIGDLDKCVSGGTVFGEEAKHILRKTNSYAEYSPSNKGVRIFALGKLPGLNFSNNKIGVEFYGDGETARFVTVTGHILEGTPSKLMPIEPSTLKELYESYEPDRSPPSEELPMVDLLPEEQIPLIDSLRLSSLHKFWLNEGFEGDDDSFDLQIVTKKLYENNLTDEEVLSLLWDAPGSHSVAMRKRGQNGDKALTFLWRHQCLKARNLRPSIGFDTESSYQEAEVIDHPRKNETLKFKILHATDVLAKLGPIDWQIEDFLEKDSTGLIFGEPGSFKSFIALDMGFHVAAGKDWHGRKVQQGPAIYLAGEGHNGLARRLAAWSTHHGVQFDDLPFYISETAASLCDKLSVIDVAAAVKSIADQKGDPSMIIIDTLARNFGPGDENSTTDMSTFIDHVDSVLRHEFGATVCLVHHSGHSNKERARGSAALKAGLDFEYRVEKIKGSLTVGFTNTKMKNAPEHTEATWFEGKEVFFGDFEDNISSLVFEMTEAPVTEEKPLKGKQAKLFELIFREGPVERETLRNITIEEGVFDNSDQFKRAVQELKKKDRIKEIDNKFSILDEFFEDGHEPDTGGHF